MRHFILALLVLLLSASTAPAWSNKEHILLTRVAAIRLLADEKTPPAMKEWLRAAIGDVGTMDGQREYFMQGRNGLFPRAVDGLAYWSTVPDLMAMIDRDGRKLEPFGVQERLLHFIDVEYFHPDERKRKYFDDLSGRPRFEDFPRDLNDERYKKAGMLPFAVEEMRRRMVTALREGRLADKPGQNPRDDHAVRWGGYLAHYLQDNTQPHHSTVDYKSRSYAKHPAKAPDVHADIEYRLVDDEHQEHSRLRGELWDLFMAALEEKRPMVDEKDWWRSTIEVALVSYAALPMIGRASVEAYPKADEKGPGQWDVEAFFKAKGKVEPYGEVTVLQLKAYQYAWAVDRVQKAWLSAWVEAETGEVRDR